MDRNPQQILYDIEAFSPKGNDWSPMLGLLDELFEFYPEKIDSGYLLELAERIMG